MKYEKPKQAGRRELELARRSGDDSSIREGLVSLALNESEDWRWVQAQCIELLEHHDWSVRAVAATCLGHVARIHRKMDLEIVVPALRGMLEDPKVSSYARDALEDIQMYVAK